MTLRQVTAQGGLALGALVLALLGLVVLSALVHHGAVGFAHRS